MNSLNRLQPLALLVMRLVLGTIMIGHGYQKVFGGFHHHMEFVGTLGLPRWMAYLSAGTEFFGGIGIVLGLFTRFFSLAILIEMGVAIWKVHFKNGLMGNGGYEFPLAVVAIALLRSENFRRDAACRVSLSQPETGQAPSLQESGGVKRRANSEQPELQNSANSFMARNRSLACGRIAFSRMG